MPDLTAQPAGDNGVNPLYNSAVFLWNGAVPGKNQVNGNTTTPNGTNTTGSGGKFQLMNNTNGAFSFPIAKPASAYTLVAVLCHPAASIGFTKTVSIPGGNFRLETQTTGGGVYHSLIHTGSAAAVSTFVSSVGTFDTAPWTYVAAYSAGTLRQYLKRGDGTTAATTTETIGYSNSGTAQIDIGETLGQVGQGVYAILLVPSDVGDAECLALRNNPWRMFSDGSGLTWTGTIPDQSSTVGTTIPALATSGYVSGGTAPYTYSATGLPPGLGINSSTGSISGTPTAAGNFSVVVSVVDSASSPATVSGAAFAWTISLPAATATTLSGPTGGQTGVASAAFAVGANGAITGTVTVTPSDGGAGGTFTPTSVAISAGTPTRTFTYAASSAGAKTISISDSGGLADAAPLTYTASATAGTLTVANIRNGAGALLVNTLLPNVVVIQRANRTMLLALTAQTTSATGVLSITSGVLAVGTECVVLAYSDDGAATGAWPAVVA